MKKCGARLVEMWCPSHGNVAPATFFLCWEQCLFQHFFKMLLLYISRNPFAESFLFLLG